MLCRFCGKAVPDKAVVCTGCGHALDGAGEHHHASVRPWNMMIFILLIITTLFVPPVGLVFGPMGLMDDARKVQGAVLTTVGIFMTILLIAIILGL